MARRPRPGAIVAHKPIPHPVGAPTPEHAAQRDALAQGGDPAMTTTPIDVALLRGRLTREQHAAAKQYRFLWNAAGCRTPHASAIDLDAGRGGALHLDLEAEQRVYDEFTGAREAIRKRCAAGSLQVVEALVIYENWPSWCWASNKLPLTSFQLRAMQVAATALNALDSYFSALYGRNTRKVRHTIMDASIYTGPSPSV